MTQKLSLQCWVTHEEVENGEKIREKLFLLSLQFDGKFVKKKLESSESWLYIEECSKYIMMKIMTHAEYTQKCSRNGIEKPKIWWRWTLSTAPLVYLVVTSISKLSLWLLDITTTACWKQQRVGQGVVSEVERRRRQRECSPTLLTFGPARHSFLAAKRRRFSRKSRHFLRTAVLQNKPSQVVLVQTLPE